MTVRRMLSSLSSLAMAFIMSTAARADPPPASHHHWRNTNYPSHYLLYERSSNTWVETVDCRVFWRFTAVSNQLNTLTLYDASRDMTAQLTYDGMYLKASGATSFTFYQAGTFDTRTSFEEHDASGNFVATISKGNGCAWSEWFAGGSTPAYNFVQRGVTAGSVEIYDGSRDISVRLDDGSMWLRQGSAAYTFFRSGRWY